MKIFNACLLIAGLTLLGRAQAHDTTDGEKPDYEAMKRKLLERFDTNGDGKLDESEREAAKKAMQKMRELREEKCQGKHEGGGGQTDGARKEEIIKRFDKNGDGKLDEDEKRAAMEAMRGMKEKMEKGREHYEELLKRFDKDGDGKLSPEEKEAARETMMKEHGEHAPEQKSQTRKEQF